MKSLQRISKLLRRRVKQRPENSGPTSYLFRS
nr:MAG TPA: hypothetical protein [Caudoviricetes sp.]